MDLLRTEDVVSVTLFDIRLSESELEYLATCAWHALSTMNDEQLHHVINDPERAELATPVETREFLESTYRELMNLIKENCRPEFLPKRFREWRTHSSSE